MQTKIATCSYCSRRQTLQLSARGGHELACGACGAPLHEMKWLKAEKVKSDKGKRSAPRSAPHGHGYPDRDDWQGDRKRRKKRRTPLWKKVAEEAFDLIEDIFD